MNEAANAPARQPSPGEQMMQMVCGKWVSRAIGVAAELGVADLLAAGPASAAALASKTGAHAPSLGRLLRALASVGVFDEISEGVFALNALGETLRSNVPGSMRDMARFQSGPGLWGPWGEMQHAVQTRGTRVRQAFGVDAWDYFGAHPDEAAVFNGAMTNLSQQESHAVAATFDFGRFTKLMDVAGGHGVLLSTVLNRFPQLRGVLFDMPSVCDGGRAAMAEAGLADRCEVVAGDFFNSIPAGADAYMMKHIIHDWDDEKSIAILRNTRAAMGQDGTLLVIEIVIPGPGVPSFGKLLDLEMLVTAGGLERTESEYRNLFAAAGFDLVVVHPTPAPVSVIEGRPRR